MEDAGLGPLDIDEDLPLLERVERACINGPPVQRLAFAKEIVPCAEEEPLADVVARIVPLLKTVACDPELGVRQSVAEQVAGLAKVLLGGAAVDTPANAYDCVLHELVPLVISLLSTGQSDGMPGAGGSTLLAETASEALLELAQLIEPADVGDTVLRAVLCLAHDNELEENRAVATQLLGALAPVLGAELCMQYVMPEVLCLADDPAFRVRKAAALKLGSVAAVIGAEMAVAKLLPVFLVLARDEIWGVRKAAVESLAEVSASMPAEVRTSALEELMDEFHKDSSRWVRIAACQALGPFIATLDSLAVSESLLSLYTELANPGSTDRSPDADVAFSCAYNFPAVVAALGPSRWPEVAESFAALSSHIQWKVRRTLSYSMHELAKLLGPELAESALLPTFETFLKDLDEVKVGVIEHLAAFLTALPPAARLGYMPALLEIKAETDNWRFRHLLASQLSAFGAAFPEAEVEETLLPLALSLCTDTVAEVRIAAVPEIGALVKHIVNSSSQKAAAVESSENGEEAAAAAASGGVSEPVRHFVATVAGMADAPSCFKRANCVQICSSLIEGLPIQLAADVLLPKLVPLTTDRVANVRLAVATLAKHKLASPELAALPVAQQLLETLQQDVDRDVLRMAHPSGYEPPPYRCKPPPPSSAYSSNYDEVFYGNENDDPHVLAGGGLGEEDAPALDEDEGYPEGEIAAAEEILTAG